MIIACDVKLCGSRGGTSCITQVSRRGDNPAAPALPWEAIPTNHYHNQAINSNNDVEQEKYFKCMWQKDHWTSILAQYVVEMAAVTLSQYCGLHRVQVIEVGWGNLTIHYQQKGDTKRTHMLLLLSQRSWLCVPTIYHQSLSDLTQLTGSRKN